jgi:hypothetical protein
MSWKSANTSDFFTNKMPGSPSVSDALERLISWIDQNGWAGWDPYDIKGKKSVLWITAKSHSSRIFIYLRELLFEFFYQFPVTSRRIFGVKKSINPKAMGLFSSSFLLLYAITKNEKMLSRATACLDWLKSNQVVPESGIGWGYPFDWYSRELIPANTPNGIVTTTAGEAFWQFYRQTGEKEYLNTCVDIADFLIDLPLDRIGENKICFSYTPLFINHVHNLNLFIAEFLLKVGSEINNVNFLKMSELAINYTLDDQREDGSFDYNGPPEEPQNFIDHYHTGFVLRMLHSIWKMSGRQDVKRAMDKCYSHYIDNFFEHGRIPKFLPDRKYRIDIHSCAEAIYCISSLSETYPEHSGVADDVCAWTLENLQDPSGHFYYAIQKSRFTGRAYISRIPYIRWAQAWMLRSMSVYYSSKESFKTD